MDGSHPYADGEGRYLGLRLPPNQVRGTPKPWKGTPVCSSARNKRHLRGGRAALPHREPPLPRAGPRAMGIQAWGYTTSQGQPPHQRGAPMPVQRGADVQVTFTLITAPAAYSTGAAARHRTPPAAEESSATVEPFTQPRCSLPMRQ